MNASQVFSGELPKPETAEWRKIVARFQTPSRLRAVWQIVNTVVPYVLLWVLMYYTVAISWWLTLPLAILAGAFLVRAFIIFHDCGHGSFFKSRRANHIWGFVCGLLTLTPYYHWRWEHSLHHATSGDLDRRGTGDIWTMTVQEYLESSRGKRFVYRLTRNPIVLFVLAPLFLFLIKHRIPKKQASRRERYSVYWMDFAVLAVAAILISIFGFKAYLLIQWTALLVAGASGFWLFYVQHQFEGVYWERRDDWDYAAAALQGSSFYKLPRVLQWFSGNIGFHHIHHLSPRIPNYYLEKCHYADPLFQTVKPITLFASFKSLTFRLWDEQRRKLVGYSHLRKLSRRDATSGPAAKPAMKVLLVYPETPDTFWSFKHVLRFISKRAAFPPLGLLTVAAMLPRDWDLRLVDTNVERLDDGDLRWADYVMISAMIVHKESVNGIVERCRKFSKTIIAGGPLFTTGHSAFPKIQHFVLGEAEEVMPELVQDMKGASLRRHYQAADRPDIATTPVPRWDLIDLGNYATMAVQFSRGCPYDCEFCDIIVMNGRVPRVKSPAQVIHELDALRSRGWKDTVFIVDDNFIGNKTLTKALLREMVQWRSRVGAGMGFLTEASVNLADDVELCKLMVAAGFKKVFLGIETPSAESLEECRKLQNQGRDLVETVKSLQRFGLEVMGGFIVGFDHDKQDVFKRQFEFIQQSGVVTAMVGLLSALPETRLYRRLMNEGRIEAETTGNNTEAVLNFRPKLDRGFLLSGYRELMGKLYEPRNYYQRIRIFLKDHRPSGPAMRLCWPDFQAFLKSFWLLGIWYRGRVAYWRFFWGTLLLRPRHFRNAIELAIVGHHFRRVASQL